jgi:hypothetical protein
LARSGQSVQPPRVEMTFANPVLKRALSHRHGVKVLPVVM